MHLKHILSPIAIGLLFSLSSFSQVTIGSENKPSTGSLLDLKENNNLEVNASKGLGLPRVILTNLNPENPTQLAASLGEVGSWPMEEHIGLLIYNAKQDMCASEPIFEGLHVWDGTKWQLINGNAKNPDVYIFNDPRDGETYTYRRFGKAGIWMTQHMRATKYSDGTPVAIYEGSNLPNPPDKGMYAYPLAGHPNWNVKPARWKKEYGVFYNYPAATRDYQGQGVNNQSQPDTSGVFGPNEIESDASLPVDYRGRHIVQGICPNGWHVPSDREWNELEKEIYQNADLYSDFTRDEVAAWNNETPWDPAWEVHANTQNRPLTASTSAHGTAMITKCPIDNIIMSGKSKSAWQGGFDIPLVGHMNNRITSNYGDLGIITSASIVIHKQVRDRALFNNDNTVQRGAINKSNLIPVRCKKNDLNL